MEDHNQQLLLRGFDLGHPASKKGQEPWCHFRRNSTGAI
jgi:hypothetical protein